MKCPKCGYERQPGDHIFVPGTECPACGVVYSKYGSDVQEAQEVSGESPSGTIKKPSPVHEDSLKQARERVEKRLRAKSAAHLPDEHRKQIMERAKLFVSEGVRKRQAEWQQRNTVNAADHGDDGDIVEKTEQTDTLMVSEQTQGVQPAALDDDAAFQPEAENGQQSDPQSLPQPEKNAPAEDNATLQARESAGSDQAPMVDTEQKQMPPDTQMPPLDGERNGQETEAFHVATEETVESMDQSPTVAPAVMADELSRQGRPDGLIRLLPTVAWIVLAAGLVGAVLSWTTLGSVYAGPSVSPAPPGGSHIPVALLLGFAYLAIGVLGFAFFWVSSMINGQLKEIRQLLMCSSAQEDWSESSADEAH